MVAQTPWRELCRFDDPLLARAVATSIAAMEFEVRLDGRLGARPDAERQTTGRPPYVVRVVADDWSDLAEVLDEIIHEQVEFDRLLAEGQTAGRHARLIAIITLTGAADLLLLFGLLDW